MGASSRATHRPPKPTTLRLIGGDWRGRRIPITHAAGLRPTPDRIRETLFNWLAPRLAGARCIDAFAGTGALGLEALSRGAGWLDFFETDPDAGRALRAALADLGATHRAAVHTRAFGASAITGGVDIVFLDPPFDAHQHAPALAELGPLLTPSARIYLEYAADQTPQIEALLAGDYRILRAKRAGRVGYCLAQPGSDGEDKRP